jgi:hypothetical protein
MTRAGSLQASTSGDPCREASNDDDRLLDPFLPAVSGRNTPANDNPGDSGLLPCLRVTDEEVTLLHRHLSREILDLFS